jgi:RNA polymerase sigma factor (sigma-70 family)
MAMPQQSGAGVESERDRAFTANPDWTDIVARIQTGDDTGMEQLYAVFAHGIRFYLCRHLRGQELEDKIHDSFLIVVKAIRRGDLREPERLMGFVRTVVRRQVAGYIDSAVHRRREQVDMDTVVRLLDVGENPEAVAIARQQKDIARTVLAKLSERDREILTRFYLHEQTQQQICDEMELTDTQFRLLKSRAKARFADEGKRKLNGSGLRSLMLRFTAGGAS